MSKRRVYFHVLIEPVLKEKLREASETRGEEMSTFVRRAIRRELARLGFLSEKEMRALEVSGR